MKCILLSAGYATRLYPLTENFPKPLLKVGEKTILDWLMDDVKELVDEFIVISNHKFAGHFQAWADAHMLPITVVDDGTSTNETRLGAVKDIQYAVDKLGIAENKLPPIYDKGTVLGNVQSKIAEKLGLSCETKVVLGSFDHPSGAMGAGVFEEGEMLLSCGTSWVEFFPVSSRDFAISTKGLVDRFMLDGAPYCVMKSITSISEKIDSLRYHYLGDISHKEYDELAKASPFGSNGLRFNFTDSDYNIDSKYSQGDIARAIIEGTALILKENLEALEKCGLRAGKITMIGGISNSSVCVKIVSEVLDRPVKVANGQAAGAIGAAMLAGIGAGVYKNEKDAYAIITG